MPEEKSDLQQISSRELVEKYHELSKELPRSAHDQARKKLLESLERGPVRDETDASLFDRGRDETGVSLIEQARRVKAEIKRRVQAGDAELDAIAAENLKSGFQGLPDKALVDSLLSAEAKRKTEHGSGLGRWRWVVERTFAWLNQFRRLRLRYEKRADIHEAFLALSCPLLCWNALQKHAVDFRGGATQ